MTEICLHSNAFLLGVEPRRRYLWCPCGWERPAATAPHVWVPADLELPDQRVCARCNEERPPGGHLAGVIRRAVRGREASASRQ